MANKWFPSWRSIRLPWKLLLVYMPLIILPAVTGIYLLMQSYIHSNEEVAAEYSTDLLNLMVLKINDRIDSYEYLSRQIMTDESLQGLLLTKPSSTFQKLQIQNAINDRLNVIWQGNKENEYIRSIKLSSFSESYTYGKNVLDNYRINEPEYIEALQQADGASMWFYPEMFTDGYRDIEAFRLGRVIRDPQIRAIGYLTIVIDVEAIRSIFEQTEFHNRVLLKLIAADGSILLDNKLPIDAEDKQQLTINQENIKNNWSLHATMSLEPLYAHIYRVVQQSIFVVFICIGIGLAITHVMVVDIVIPIRKLMMNMKQGIKGISPSNLKRFRGAVEIVEMNDTFISVMYEIEQLIRQVVKEQEIKQSAEIRVLQNQLSPHFLYNTLNTIRWMAILQKQDHIKEMIDSLNALLTYSLREAGKPVMLQEELSMLQDYVNIQQVRYEHFTFVIDVDDELKSASMLKFLIQPLIENALIHGISSDVEQGRITISAVRNQDVLEVTVQDNGCGIEPDRLTQLQNELSNNVDNSNHLGLRNVYERIQLHYGWRYGLTIESEQGMGVHAVVRIPYRTIPITVGGADDA